MKDKTGKGIWVATITRVGISCDICGNKFKVGDKCQMDVKKGVTLCKKCLDKHKENDQE